MWGFCVKLWLALWNSLYAVTSFSSWLVKILTAHLLYHNGYMAIEPDISLRAPTNKHFNIYFNEFAVDHFMDD